MLGYDKSIRAKEVVLFNKNYESSEISGDRQSIKYGVNLPPPMMLDCSYSCFSVVSKLIGMFGVCTRCFTGPIIIQPVYINHTASIYQSYSQYISIIQPVYINHTASIYQSYILFIQPVYINHTASIYQSYILFIQPVYINHTVKLIH